MLNDVYCYYVETQADMTVVFAVSLDDYVPVGLLQTDDCMSSYVSPKMFESFELIPVPEGIELFPEQQSEFA